MSTKYLTGKRLANRIRLVMAGDEPKMCVAFLGPKWAEELFEDGVLPEDLRVVCDLRMGMTVRSASAERQTTTASAISPTGKCTQRFMSPQGAR
ncbi:hypothetical protein GGR95_000371 [Sulfitobacter undariae]|uniref:Uncharacterized protein n=1 Tax=Sulfitobacter undariae TaxID=1563671 RepID=A0A7W6E102_9RHOB|nr:hypothetical protein [Sulfitobacter undariae]MBB3992752.1 hypothetical protein [Sulfitobacter undariae]